MQFESSKQPVWMGNRSPDILTDSLSLNNSDREFPSLSHYLPIRNQYDAYKIQARFRIEKDQIA